MFGWIISISNHFKKERHIHCKNDLRFSLKLISIFFVFILAGKPVISVMLPMGEEQNTLIPDRNARMVSQIFIAIENMSLPSAFLREPQSYKVESIEDFRKYLDKLAYHMIAQFPDVKLQEAAWMMIFQPEESGESDGRLQLVQPLADSRLAYGFFEEGKPPQEGLKVSLDPRLKFLPTWWRIYRILAAIEMAHQFEHIQALSSGERIWPFRNEAEAMAQVNSIYTTFISSAIFALAPHNELAEETLSATAVDSFLVNDLLRTLHSYKSNESEIFNQMGLSLPLMTRGVSAEKIDEMVYTVVSKIQESNNRLPLWNEVKKNWISIHRNNIIENEDYYGPISFKNLRRWQTLDPLVAKVMLEVFSRQTPQRSCENSWK